jgi:hypothetical protein
MGSSDIHIAALLGGQPSLAENASIPRAKVASPVLPASEAPAFFAPDSQQDRVSLSGTLPPQQREAAPPNGNAQSAPFTLLAQEITFPPGQSTADVFSTSTFPSAATPADANNASAVATISASSSGSANVIATSGAQAVHGGQSPVATAAENAAATASPTGVASAAPAEQTLQQLDQELQQLGIDPQSLSLISRGGMLNSINDPAALRQIVQNVRYETNPQPQAAVIAVAKPEQNTAPSGPQPAAGVNTNVVNQNAATAQPTAVAAMQFQKLEESLAARGIQQASPAANQSGTATQHGQLLNISA